MGVCMYQEIAKFSKSKNQDEICLESYKLSGNCPIEFLFPAFRFVVDGQSDKLTN